MDSKTIARIKRRGQEMSLTGIIIALSVGVLLPVLLSTALGIVTLAMGEDSNPIVTGVLIVSFAAAALGSIVTVTVLLSKRARTARMQADLLANVSHDLRTPLSSIRMYAQTILGGQLKDDPDRMQQSLDTIIRETKWLDSMVDRLLTWRAAAKDRIDLQMELRPLRGSVETALHRFQSMLPEGEVELSLDIASQTLVRHDSQAIGSILLNLLINAFKYSTPPKKISVSVKDHARQVAISVADNGIGIPSKEMRQIFEPFYRLDSKLTSKSSGAGLGLAIVAHLVKAHKGEVLVESKEGQGSTFTVLLPCISEENAT